MPSGKVQMLMQINASKASSTNKEYQLKVNRKGPVEEAKTPH